MPSFNVHQLQIPSSTNVLITSEENNFCKFNRYILDALLKRERLGSTGIGKGIAIPHGRIDNLEQTIAVLVVNRELIAFDAIDNQGVDIFIALLVPESQCEAHLKTLAKIADKLKDKEFCKKIRNAPSDQALFDVVATL